MSRYRRANIPGATYFFTVVTYRRRPILCDAPVRMALRDAIKTVQSRHSFTINPRNRTPVPPNVERTRMSDDLAGVYAMNLKTAVELSKIPFMLRLGSARTGFYTLN